MSSPMRLLPAMLCAAWAAQLHANTATYLEALRLAADKCYDEALAKLSDVARQEPSFTRAYSRILTIQKTLGRPEAARSFFATLASDSSHPYAHYALALWYRDQKQYEEAERQAKLAIEKSPDALPAYKELVDAAAQGKQLERAETFLNELVVERPSAAVSFGLAHVERLRRNWVRALDHLNRAESLTAGIWEVASARFTALYQSDRHREALVTLRRMLEMAEHGGDRERESFAHGQLGLVHSELGDYSQALQHLKHAVEWAREIGDRRSEQAHRGQLGLVYIYLARYPQALEECRTALRIAEETGMRLDMERNLGLVARIYEETADYPKAIDTLEEAVRIAREVSDRPGEADHLARLSNVSAAIGEQDKALAAAMRGLEIARELRNPWLEGNLLEVQGRVQWSLGRRRETLQALERGVEIARTIGDRLGEATRLARASEVRASAGDSEVALQGYEAALQIAADTGAKILEGEVRNSLGKLYLARGELAKAQDSFSRALEIGLATDMTEVAWRAHAGLGATLDRNGLKSAAGGHYRKAIEAVERVRGSLPMTESRAAFLEDKIDVYKKLVRLLADNEDPQAFHYAERARARAFLDTITESSVLPHNTEPEFTARLKAVEGRLSELQAGIVAQYTKASVDRQAVRELTAELARKDEEHFRLRREIRRNNPVYAAFRYPEPLDLKEARALAGSGVLLAYSVDAGQSLLFALTRDAYRVTCLPGAAAIEARVRRLREAVAAGPARAAWANYVVEARALYREILAPVADLMKGREDLIVVPDGALHYLPFELLLRGGASRPSGFRDLPYLARDFTIRYAASASVLAALEGRPKKRATRSLLALGDPTYGGGESEPNAQRGALLQQVSEGFARLGESRREVESIGRLHARASVFTGDRASEETIRAARLSDYRILHFAVHGVTDEFQPRFSALVLSRPRPGATEDGLLQSFEISSLDLSAELVVLSGCETAMGRRLKGEGLVGLTQAFLSAGASSVIASLWKVQDRSTAELMIRFHRHLRDGRLSTAQALRRARLELIEEGTYAHPYYWAPFVLFGDSRAPGK